MMSSLPTFMPRGVHTLWYRPTQSSRDQQPFSSATLNPPHGQQNASQPHQQPQNQHTRRRNPTGARRRSSHAHESTRAPLEPPSALQALTADEMLLARRKENIRKFGAGWLKPPGIAKTLQAGLDEAAERAEQEAAARREESAREIREAQERMEHQQRLEQMAQDAAEGDVAMGMDRDLDEEVPDAEEVGWGNDDDMERDDGEFELQGFGDVDGDRNLDDDVPEAGSYQHTDTDVEDASSDEQYEDAHTGGLPNIRGMTVVQNLGSGFRSSFAGGIEQVWLSRTGSELQGEVRPSIGSGIFDGSPPQAESSLLLSSPTGARGAGGAGRPAIRRHAQ